MIRFSPVLRLLILAVLVLAVGTVRSQIVIRKTAEDENPPLHIRSFSGPGAVETMLKETLRRCDWFRVVGRPSEDGFVLDARYLPGNPAGLEVRVSRGGQVVASFREGVGAKGDRRAVYSAVDRVVEKVFSNPGPCQSRLAFVMAGQGRKEVFTCNFDGSEMKRLTHNRSISTEPSWSRDGRQMVYTLYRGKTTQIIQIDVAGGRQRRIAGFPGLNAGAALSPDGTSVALCLSRDKKVDLYVMRIEDGKPRRLTSDIAVESSPTWSPDGRRICYVSDRAGGRPQLYLVGARGGKAARLLNDLDEAVSPDWSSVSNRICFATRRGGQYVIAVVDMAEADLKKQIVTSIAGDFEAPSWSPDGRHLVCSHSVRGGRELCMVDAWTGRIIKVTEPGPVSLPSWGRAE